MALIVVNLTDTFNDWRLKTNTSIAQIGDLTTQLEQREMIVSTIDIEISRLQVINKLLKEDYDDGNFEIYQFRIG